MSLKNKPSQAIVLISAVFARLLIVAIASSASLTVMADGGMPIKDAVMYSVPENLDRLSTEEITHMRDERQRDLEKTNTGASAVKQAEEKLFKQLMTHDLVRLSIADVIPQMIKEYEIDGEFKKTLMGYRSTFGEDLIASREAIENLEDYPSYDFRFAAVYMSMLYSFQKYPDFYERLKQDMLKEDTSIGSYKKVLDESYATVKQVRAEMDMIKSGDDLKKLISALDSELAKRSH